VGAVGYAGTGGDADGAAGGLGGDARGAAGGLGGNASAAAGGSGGNSIAAPIINRPYMPQFNKVDIDQYAKAIAVVPKKHW
jgi:hypothetical protein